MPIDCTRRALALCSLGAWLGPVWGARNTEARTLMVLGDSLSAEYGLPRGTGWVALMEQRIAQARLKTRVVNASISGETTSGGLSRLPALLSQHKPDVVVIELGANDALRGLPLDGARRNLSEMVRLSQEAGARVLLVGMMVPPNYGKRYADDFAALFGSVSEERKVPLVPFFLKGVADRPDARDWFQADGTHPLPKAHPVMLDLVWPKLQPLLRG
ncbi:arylesterase [Aquabacterium sp.]|uniref:arylesterase n=2 Tax=Aquabacterium TaxID=92793 RepID=UPI0035C69A50